MKFIYNSLESGSEIKGFRRNFVEYNHPVGKIMQYEDKIADELLATYPFLQDLSRADVEKVLESQKKKPFACEFCNFSTDAEIGLISHKRTHAEEIKEKENPLDATLVPMAGEKVEPRVGGSPKIMTNIDAEEGITGPEFYGEGFVETHGKTS